ncbi:MAG: threonine synthase, partial [Flavobacteriales bacterium]|nr:threonine synthase [Flavobacteriales bacterium]
DSELNEKYMLSSANSINIARLIPQSFYYVGAYAQLDAPDDLVFCVPSGNFGNLTAGLIAHRMGLPVQKIIAATNVNDIVPSYLQNGKYEPRPSQSTISNAMDVGDPSNFQRMEALFNGKVEQMKEMLVGNSFSDDETRASIQDVFERTGYTLDPHGAVGYLALKDYHAQHACTGVLLETAHPAKFLPVMDELIDQVDVPHALSRLKDLEKVAYPCSIDFEDFKSFLLDR